MAWKSKHRKERSCTLSQSPRKEKRREPRRRRKDPQKESLTFREPRRREIPAAVPMHSMAREVHRAGMEATTTLHMFKAKDTATLDFAVSEMVGRPQAPSKVGSHPTESPQMKRLTVLFTANQI